METPELVASWSEVRVTLGTLKLWLACEVRAVLGRMLPLNSEVWPNSGCHCTLLSDIVIFLSFSYVFGRVVRHLVLTYNKKY